MRLDIFLFMLCLDPISGVSPRERVGSGDETRIQVPGNISTPSQQNTALEPIKVIILYQCCLLIIQAFDTIAIFTTNSLSSVNMKSTVILYTVQWSKSVTFSIV